MKGKVAIIGGGIIGTVTAIELNRLGHEVVVIDREAPGSSGAASFGNGGWLCPASIIPVSVPSLIWRLPYFILGKSAPLSGNLRFAIRNVRHFMQFVNSGLTSRRVLHKAEALSSLLSNSADRHLELAKEAGLEQLIKKDGLLYTYNSEQAFRTDLGWWDLRRDLGVKWKFLNGNTLQQEEPGIERDCFGAVLVEDGGHCTDPAAYTKGLADHARQRGVTFIEANVTRLIHSDGLLSAIETTVGPLDFDAVIVCAGAHSRPLAYQVGDDPPLISERGYHVTVAMEQRLRRPVMFNDALMVATPMLSGTRFAGQVEISAQDSPPDWSRAGALLDLARRYFGSLPADIGQPGVSVWMGHRPAIADELPVIGRATRVGNVYFAFGHGFTGLGAAPATATLIGSFLQKNGVIPNENSPFSPQRFPALMSHASQGGHNV